eukprot:jgi/Picre1/35802/NNA_003262.t1
MGVETTPTWTKLGNHASEIASKTHLKTLLKDEERTKSLTYTHNGVYIDFSRQNATVETQSMLLDLARECKVEEKIARMFQGDHLNETEDRAVLHVALRAPRDASIFDKGNNVVPGVWEVLDKIKEFSARVREGQVTGVTGKPLTQFVAIGIGGSYLGPAFIHNALENDPEALKNADGRTLTFLANVDPVDCVNALKHLDPERTLAIIVSKTFTTAETMRNARTVRAWLTKNLGDESIAKHMVAVSTNLKGVEEFGINPENTFGFWDWVGGRFSASSAVGALPLSLQYGFDIFDKFLQGMRDIDEHVSSSPLEQNIPVLMALYNVWNTTFLGHSNCAILPYAQALSQFPAHVQQLSMESNGKGVAMDGSPLPYQVGEIDFGEAGTNGQHSFYQLVHQGRVVPAEFIGVLKSQQDVFLSEEQSSSHEELLCNFFAQPDALATGKSAEELREEGVPEALIPHKTFTGNRPSMSLVLPALDAFRIGQLLSLYEHRIAVSGFIWNINSFDQWGVELGKVLAGKVRKELVRARGEGTGASDGFNHSTRAMLNMYLEHAGGVTPKEGEDIFPTQLLR